MRFEEIEKKINQAIEQNGSQLAAVAEKILKSPELGFCEENTSQIVRSELEQIGIEYSYPHAITGVMGKLHGKSDKFNICIIGEMDAVKCGGHPYASAALAAHACGHNAQIAAMLGAARGLKESGVLEELDGCITFMAVPAEEFIELDYRKKLIADGKIKYMSGKQQLIYEGAFDDVDMAFMLHAQPDEPDKKLYVRGYNLGFSAETITFHGKAAHGSTPCDGVNALNAAALSIIGIHSNRETFKDEDRIRIHPIITKGGDVVNSVPDEVCIDTYVRGATLEAIEKGNKAVERSVSGAAQIIGATVQIDRVPGYLPLKESSELSTVLEAVGTDVLGSDALVYGKEITGSSDIGDLSHLIPVVQPSVGGFSGKLHSRDFTVTDAATAYVKAAQILACTAASLLCNNGEKAAEVKKAFKPKMTKQEYLNYLNTERK